MAPRFSIPKISSKLSYFNKGIANLFLIVFCILTFIEFGKACDDSSVFLVSQTNNGNGTYTYVIRMCLEFDTGIDPELDEFRITVNGTTINSFAPSSVSHLGQVYTGSNTATVLTYTCPTFPISMNTDQCYDISITTNGIPTSFTCSTNANGTAWECLNRTIVIGGITQTTCATTTFTDPGGASNYPNNNSSGTTICPVTPGDKVSVTFNSFDIRATFGTCLDQLQIYQGNLPIISNQIGVFCTGTFPPTTITSNTADGCLTFIFMSDASSSAPGWTATVSCIGSTPTGSGCECSTPNCGGAHFCNAAAAQADYGAASPTAIYDIVPDLSTSTGTNYTLCWNYTTGPSETRIGFVNAIGNTSGANPLCSFTRTYRLLQSNCSTVVPSAGASSFGTGNEYVVTPNTSYRFCVIITYTSNSCGSLADNYVWVYDDTGGTGNCGSTCGADAGTYTVTGAPLSGGAYQVPCCGSVSVTWNGDGTNAPQGCIGGAEKGYAIFTCAQTAANLSLASTYNTTNPCFRGIFTSSATISDGNNSGFSSSLVSGAPDVWIVPVTLDCACSTDGTTCNGTNNVDVNGDGCVDFAGPFRLSYAACSSGGCGTCGSPCTGPGINGVSTYTNRTFLSCWEPTCPIYGPRTFTNCFQATADATGFLGFANARVHDGLSSCISATWKLSPTGSCATTITNPIPNANSVSSGFNPEYSGLTPNGTYVLCINYTLSNPLCGFDGITDGICIDYYGNPCSLVAATNVTQTTCGNNNGAITVTPAPPGYTYAWAGSGVTTNTRTGLSPGSYTVTVTQTATGCRSTATVTINSSTPLAIGGNITQTTCGNNNGAIEVTPAPPGYTYSWAGSGITTNTRTGLSPGSYTVTVTETATGCKSSSTFTITPSSLFTISPTLTQPSCGLDNGSILVNPAPPNYTYAWSNATLLGNNPMNLGAGTYTVTVTENATGCRTSSSFILNPSSGIIAGANVTQTTCGNNNGAISVTPTGASYTYNWSDIGLGTATRTNLGAGNYIVTVTNSVGGCTSSTSITINGSTPFSVGSNVTQTSCGQDNGAILVTPTPPGYTYAWAGSGITTNIRTGLATGDYTVTVTQTASGCISTISITINPSIPFAVGENITQASCGNNNGAISVTPTPPGYTYAWAGSGVTTNIRTGLGAGDYTVTVTETATGCKTNSSFTINPSSPLVLIPTVSQPSCGLNNGAIEINPPPPGYTYAWSNAALTGNNPMNLGAGTYSVTVTEIATGCRASSSFTLNASSGLTAGANITQTSCGQDNGAITVTPAGAGFTYNWGDIGLSSSIRTNLAPGNYVVTVTNTVGGCASSTSITINGSTPFSVGSNVSQTSCGQDNGAISVTPAPPGYSYAWAGSGITTDSRTGLAAGDYTVTVTQTASGCKSTTSITINPSTPFAIGGNITQASCGNNNGAIAVSPAPPGYTYAWAGSGVTSNIRTGLGAGDYTVTVTETATGCRSSSIFTITSTGALVLNPIVSQPSCGLNNGAIEINPPPPGYTYAWSNAALSGNNPMNLGAGTFTVTVTEIATGCRASSSFTLNASSGLTAGANITQTSCGQDNGAISITPTGASYTYNWSDIGLSSSIRTNLAPGNYIVTVTNTVGGCASSTSITINGSMPFSVGSNVTQTSCGQDNGVISVTPAPPGYTYAWAGSGITTNIRTGLAAGDYTVTVTQTASGCISTASITINPSTPFAIGGNITQASCGNNNGAVSVTPAPPGYSYAWAGSGVITNIRTGLGAGDYTVTVTETATGCKSSSIFTITSTGALVLNPIVSQPSCGLNNGAIEINPPPPGYTYAWSNAALSGNNPMNLGAGTFTVTVTETATGCRASSSFTLNASSGLTAGANITQTSCGQDNGAITVTPAGAGFTYNWGDIGLSSSTRTNLASGNYVVTVTNTVGGCASSTSITINSSMPFSVGSNVSQTSCGQDNGAISVTPAPPGYTYAWAGSGITTNIRTGLAAGDYTVTVTQTTSGCKSTASITINPSIPFAIGGNITQASCGNNNGAISVTPAPPGYSYAWAGSGVITNIRTGLGAGDYTVTVTETATGCKSSSIFTITSTGALVLNPIVSQPSCGLNNGAIEINPPPPGYSYAWSNAALSGNNPMNLGAGTFTVTVTETATGCRTSSSFTLNASSGLTAGANITQTSCGQDNGAITVTPAGAGFTYNWGDIGLSSSIRTNLAPGNYIVTVTNTVGGCASSTSITINGSTPFSVGSNVTQTSCGQDNGAISVTPAPPGYSYAWAGSGITTDSRTGLAAGDYTVTVTQTASGCKSTTTITINPSTPFAIGGNITQASCGNNNGAIAVSPAPPGYTYAWAGSGVTSNIRTGLGAGDYTVTVTETSTGCRSSSTFTITSTGALVLNPIVSQPSCGLNNGAVEINPPPPGYTYAWSNAALSGNNPMNLGAGTFTVTVTETATGCRASSSFTLNASSGLTAGANITQTSCGQDNGAITVTPTGAGFTYNWGDIGFSSSIRTNLAPGNYVVTVTNTVGGCAASTGFTINGSTNLSISFNGINPSCGLNNGSISVTPNGVGYSYTWQGLGNPSGANPNNLSAGTYSVTVSDIAAGCSSVSFFVLTASQGLNVSGSLSNPSCGLNNGSISVTPNGVGYSYIWQGLGNASGANPTNLSGGTYTVTVTDIAAGCSSVSSFVLTASQGLNVSGSLSNPSCGLNNGSISVTPNGVGYSFTWQGLGNPSGANPNSLSAGTYSVTVTDIAAGCSSASSFILVASPGVSLNCLQKSPASSGANADGIGSVFISGGAAPYTILWVGPSSGQQPGVLGENSVNGLVSGAYSVVVRDGNNCSANCGFSITNSACTLNASSRISSPISCFGLSDGKVELTVNQGIGTVNVNWSNGQNSTSVNNLSQGTYRYTVTDGIGCKVVDSISLIAPLPINFNINIDSITCLTRTGTIRVTSITNGTPPYKYSFPAGQPFTNFNGSLSLNNLIPGTHILTIQDERGCQIRDTVVFDSVSGLTVDLPDLVEIELGESVQLIAITNKPTSQISQWNWSSGPKIFNNNSDILIDTPKISGTYRVRVTDLMGCTSEDLVNVIVKKNIKIYIPNAFSPNGDGINDVFRIYSDDLKIEKVNYLRIFDRWGNMVHEEKDFTINGTQKGWNGTFKLLQMKPAVFVYSTEITLLDGSIIKKTGDVTLVE